jgi:hypothetical protein
MAAMSLPFSDPVLWATLACAAATVAAVFEKKVDLAKFIREPGIRSLSGGVVLVLLMMAAVVLMALALLAASW